MYELNSIQNEILAYIIITLYSIYHTQTVLSRDTYWKYIFRIKHVSFLTREDFLRRLKISIIGTNIFYETETFLECSYEFIIFG